MYMYMYSLPPSSSSVQRGLQDSVGAEGSEQWPGAREAAGEGD